MRTDGILGRMPGIDRRTTALEPFGDRRGSYIGARDLVSKVQQHLGDPAHADAADTHKVNVLDTFKQSVFTLGASQSLFPRDPQSAPRHRESQCAGHLSPLL